MAVPRHRAPSTLLVVATRPGHVPDLVDALTTRGHAVLVAVGIDEAEAVAREHTAPLLAILVETRLTHTAGDRLRALAHLRPDATLVAYDDLSRPAMPLTVVRGALDVERLVDRGAESRAALRGVVS